MKTSVAPQAKKVFVYLLLGAASLLGAFHAHARPYTAEDAGYEVLLKSEEMDLSAAGTWKLQSLTQLKILSDKGVQELGIYRIPFNSRSHRVSNIKAEVSYDGETSAIDPRNIEEKSVGSAVPGFDDVRYFLLPLPSLRVGARILIQYQLEQFQAEVKDHLSERIVVSSSLPVKEYILKLRHPSAIKVEVHDPSKRLSIKRSQTKDGILHFEARGSKLPSASAVYENSSLPSRSEVSWVAASTFESFPQLGKLLGADFDQVLNQEIPAPLRTIFGKKPSRPLTQSEALRELHEVMTKISARYRYFGDWRTVEGRALSPS
jgi:hypothetical protein